jgi:hypothetical protein
MLENSRTRQAVYAKNIEEYQVIKIAVYKRILEALHQLKGEENGDGAGDERNKQQYDSQGLSHIRKGSVKIQQMPGPCRAVPENPT